MNGLTLAIIAGVPLGALVGDRFGWRTTFLCVAGLAALSLLGIHGVRDFPKSLDFSA